MLGTVLVSCYILQWYQVSWSLFLPKFKTPLLYSHRWPKEKWGMTFKLHFIINILSSNSFLGPYYAFWKSTLDHPVVHLTYSRYFVQKNILHNQEREVRALLTDLRSLKSRFRSKILTFQSFVSKLYFADLPPVFNVIDF